MANYSNSKEHILRSLVSAPLHGYGIIKAVEAATDGKKRLAVGTLYGSLDVLERDGLVTQDREEVVDGRLRRYFEITESGTEQLSAWGERTARVRRKAERRVRPTIAARTAQ